MVNSMSERVTERREAAHGRRRAGRLPVCVAGLLSALLLVFGGAPVQVDAQEGGQILGQVVEQVTGPPDPITMVNNLQFYVQLKFTEFTSPHTLASGWEMLLVQAEADPSGCRLG